MYTQALWVDTKNNAKIAQLVEAEDWVDAVNQCDRAYGENYVLRNMILVEFALDPYNINGNAYSCSIQLKEGGGLKQLLVMADSFVQAQEQLMKFGYDKIISIRLTPLTYKTRA